ncbi:UNVERIFIED_ORG: diguanylate cyclase/phosphodiesterase with PAS/PAC sensor(s) [Idiomarina abyssalis]|uniref:putative bifunctional diguanylate cyclase/phosphodiesterase n=1 Tax=unclassified Idiomarina TaxID=2614829 RepID=UPI000E0E36DE|nr:EAL domain-containing protein [Idiomarina sp. 017G]TDO45123.1 diguanylate cyclase/phosphodiesterase with PAS/PAC sensor(s) [Idiomarina sp. 017G]
MQDSLPEYSLLATGIAIVLIATTIFVVVVRKRAEKKYQGTNYLIQSHYEAFNSLARHRDIESRLLGICRLIESQIDGAMCSIMAVDKKTQTLSTAASVSLPKSYNRALDGLAVADGVGACGTAAALGEPVLVADMRKDQRFNEFRSLLEQQGLVACWSHPIFATSDSDVIGTFAIYFSEPRVPLGPELEIIVRNRDLVALIIEQEEQRRKQARLEQSQSSLFTHNPDAVFMLDLEGNFTSVNRSVCELLLLKEEDLLGKHYELAVPESDQKRTSEHFEAAKAGIPQSYEIKVKDQTGQLHDLAITNIPIIIDGEITGVHGIAKDITERIQREEALEFFTSHDSLTHLVNRSAMEQRLQQLQENKSDAAIFVLFIDLDGFKPINDSLGHYLGDEVLIETAQRLQQVVSEPNLLCRFGGDEFVAVIQDMSAVEQVNALCAEVLAVFEQPFRIGEVEVSLSAAIGVSANDIEFKHPMELTQRADVAMYEAKKRGGNSVYWYSANLDEGLGYKVALRTKIQEALAQEQFELFYQPIMTDKGQVAGAEALIRWQHPTKGYVSPADFIPVAERTGQIIPISEWVLKQACRDLQQLKLYGIKSVSVNFSPIQFYREDFVSKTKAILEQFDIKPGEITVEITENVLVNDTQRIAELLQQLRDLGLDVAIDDFGSGFASLRYLNMLPVNKLKIDRSFIENIHENSHNAAITCGILSMVAGIGIETVAEGVEKEEECAYLVEHGCHFMQGFLFSKPKPLGELLKWAERQQSFENER